MGFLTSNVDNLSSNIFELLNKKKHLTRNKEIDKSILSLINTSKMFLKKFVDQIITQEILMLAFSLINDQTNEILSKYNITYNTLLEKKLIKEG